MLSPLCEEIRRFLLLFLAIAAYILLPHGAQAQNVSMGQTYHQLDSQILRVVTEFADASTLTERLPGGAVRAELLAGGGHTVLARLTYDPGSPSAVIELPQGPRVIEVRDFPFGKATTDWASLQLYSIWADSLNPHLLHPLSDLEWHGNLLRLRSPLDAPTSRDEARAHERALRRQVLAITTEFGPITASSRRTRVVAPPLEEDVAVASFTTRLYDRNGAVIGLARMFETEEVFVWDLPGVSSGFVSDSTVPGGWTFDHNMAWSNVQGFAFWYFARQLRLKNDIGCDGLHWLDNTVYRQCCDQHDQCYGYDPQTNQTTVNDPCSAWSWLFVEGWRCMQCNLEAIWCFITSSFGPGRPGGGGSCIISQAGAWCPAECFTCYHQAY